jgi:hypothetical protein
MTPVAGGQLPAGARGAVVSHCASTCGQQTPPRLTSAGRASDGTHAGLGMGAGAGWAARARDGRGARCDVRTRALDGMRTRMVGCGAR